ncbi:MAG TPA: L-threonylcarbamoyladenylate synthase [Candidatus Peribacterales bacterium]|nr:L-threonylcarbamoyladenylate synthase [Candidatus Peribacterales bacterium]
MRTLPADHGLNEAVAVLRSGGIVAHATETCYGFACDLTNPDVVRKLFLLKDRPEEVQMSALFSSLDAAKEWVEWNEKAEELARKYLPGPLTIILPMRSGKRIAMNDGQSLGVRISSHPIAQKLAELSGVLLSTTSANLHGEPSAYSAEEIVAQFKHREVQPDLILDSGILQKAPPSTVLVIEGEEVRIVRQGTILI